MKQRPRQRALARAVAALLVVCGMQARASADGRQEQDPLSAGVALRREHRDAEALVLFRRAYATDPSPQLLAQIALAEAAVGQWVSGEADLLRALASNDAWIARRRAELQVALEEIDGHLATIDADGPDGAELWIDGVFAAKLPVGFVRVPTGKRSMELRAEGFAPSRRDLEALPKAHERVTFVLEALPVRPPTAAPSPASQVPASPGAVDTRQLDSSAGFRRTMAWTAAGGAVALLGTGLGLTVVAANLADHYNDDTACGDTPTMPRSVHCASTASQYQAAQAGAVVSFAVAGGAAVASGVLFLSLPGEPRRAVGVACTPAPAGVWCAGVF
jgi:hypothetical protein